MIGIIDYGTGNLKSVYNAFRYLGQDAKVCEKGEELSGVDKVVLPGVGSSRDALEGLASRGMIDALKKSISDGKPFLGICLGLQLLYTHSEESGGCDCLGLLKGDVRLFPGGGDLKVPQIGWNTVAKTKDDCPLFKGIEDGSFFYFVHSYYCESDGDEFTSGITEYGVKYTSAVWKDNMYAVQFHPERSQVNGLKMLENFIKL
ncbi:MAG: imidazole glycerol phosphate synthase subunit HisH [Candidatus Tantalella remota]|nr:imidazole glycerol phosphate synthase subunit HisH [Candidatus Tantalella remota]